MPVNAIGAGDASASTLLDLAERFQGDHPAVIQFHSNDVVSTLSYSQLATNVRRVAAGLQGLGVGSGKVVAIWGPNSAEWITAYFAIVAAGGIVMPLDEQLAADQLHSALHKLESTLVFTENKRVGELPAACHHILLDAECGLADFTTLESWRRPKVIPSDTAAVLLTSGTTGEPKAVPLTHANLCTNAGALARARIIESSSRVLLPLPLHHAYPWMAGALTVLTTGATVIFPDGLTGPAIMRAANSAHATAIVAVPRLYSAMWEGIEARLDAQRGVTGVLTKLFLKIIAATPGRSRIVVGRVLFRRVHRELAPSLRLFACGGAKLDSGVARNLEGLGWKVLTGYGLTETSPVLTFNPKARPRLDSVGLPVPGVEIRIGPHSATQHGEIQARGPSVFGGYWGDDAATRAAFTDDGWFRTGDLGYLDSDGYLHIAGRSKELLVLADGKNVMPEEVEAAYAASIYVEDVAILERNGKLVALVVPDEAAIRQRGAVREAALLREEIDDAASRLPSYQRVTGYRVARQALPRTHLGKLQRHLLGAVFDGAASAESPVGGVPLGEADQRLLSEEPAKRLWGWLQMRFPGEELSLDTSPQFDLAVDSLGWVSLTLEIEQRFGIALNDEAVSRIFTLRDLLVEASASEVASPRHGRRPGTGVDLTSIAESPGLLFRGLDWFVSVCIGPLMRVFFRLQTVGRNNLPPQGPFLLVPNHTSYLDPPAIAAALPRHQLKETWWAGYVGVMHAGPFSRLLSRATRVFPVDPDRDLSSGISTAVELLRQGKIVVWFPEGRRSPTGEVQRFLAGVGLVLRECPVPVVPVVIDGSFHAWPKHRRLPRIEEISVRFGAPINVNVDQEEAPLETAERFCSELYQAVDELVKSKSANVSK